MAIVLEKREVYIKKPKDNENGNTATKSLNPVGSSPNGLWTFSHLDVRFPSSLASDF
jgi:hypothetical protein